ncbi:MAG: thioredoxin domain-containing protein [Kofleriaceae bacterium]
MLRYARVLLLVSIGCGAAAPATTSPASSSTTPPDVEARLARLEAENAKYAKALEFLQVVYEQQREAAEAQARALPAPDAVFAVPVAAAVAAGQVLGPVNAPVTIVKVYDFACPYCAQLNPLLERLVADYRGQVRVVYESLVVHPFAAPAHLGACAASKQGKYLAFKKAIWEKVYPAYADARDPSLFDEAHIVEAAKAAGLDGDRLRRDLSSTECKAHLEAERKMAETFHVTGTPSVFVNGTMMTSIGEAQLRSVIDEKLRVAAASGVPAAEYYAREIEGKGERVFRSTTDPKP